MCYDQRPARRPMTERTHETSFPGFSEIAQRRRRLAEGLSAVRTAKGLSQTQVAARMGTSQSAVARLEAGWSDVRLSTLERYARAVNGSLSVELRADD